MSLIDLPTARAHLRVDPDYPDVQVVGKLATAEKAVASFLNRRVFADADALAAAVSAVPAALAAASVAYEAAMEAAAEMEDPLAQCEAKEYAAMVYRNARTWARETYGGMVMDELVEGAILLTLTALHEKRGNDVDARGIPQAAIDIVHWHRIGLGV